MHKNKSENPPNIPVFILIGAAVVAGIVLLKSCDRQRTRHDMELKGLGMLEAKGFSDDLPSEAGIDYYCMRDDPSYASEDYQNFFARIKSYQHGFGELRKKGLSESDIRKIPEETLMKAARSGDAALGQLAKQYD